MTYCACSLSYPPPTVSQFAPECVSGLVWNQCPVWPEYAQGGNVDAGVVIEHPSLLALAECLDSTPLINFPA